MPDNQQRTCRAEHYLIISTPRVLPKGGTTRLETRYRVYHTPSGKNQDHATIRLVKGEMRQGVTTDGVVVKEFVPTKDVYDITLTDHGPVCDCASFTYGRDGGEQGYCKHIAAAQHTGYLPRYQKAT